MAKKNTNLSNFESDLKKLQDILEDIESDKLSLEAVSYTHLRAHEK